MRFSEPPLGLIASMATLSLLALGCAGAPAPEESPPPSAVDIPAPPDAPAPSPGVGASAPGSASTTLPSDPPKEEVGHPGDPLSSGAPSSPPPSAPTTGKARAQQLFDEGRIALRAGDTARACNLFEQSFLADPAIGTVLNLANCREMQGQKTPACRAYRQAEKMAAAAGQVDRGRFAADKASALGCP